MEKYIKDGSVAILISLGYGAGWYTWNSDTPELLYEPVIVQMLLDGKPLSEITQYTKQKYPDAYVGGADGLAVRWVPVGSRFRVEQYDGAEYVVYDNPKFWNVA